ncbi:Fur family transcriptional regulator [Hirschia maritima]|uniref:Fur family transcriptional regulator n=1 Tax=Hirschia maritima TaxID=1121961 RepID=UPI00037E699C|nr:Fur family transcriptional regulator [Hirschia maritima]
MTKDDLVELFNTHDMRLTRPRLAVAELLLLDGVNKHVSAEWVASELEKLDVKISLASVYNTLNSFVEIELLREIEVGGSRVVFDTNTTQHHHFLKVSTGELIDIDEGQVEISKLPTPPEGLKIKRCDLIVQID